MLSCCMYVLGNVTFIVGSVLFFPRILAAGGPVIRLSAVWLFVLGSVIFFLGALIDLLVVLRAAAAERGSRHRAQITQETTEMTAPDLTESELTERQSEAPAAVGTLSR